MKPFPNLEFQRLGDCDAIQYVQSMQIEPSGVIYDAEGVAVGTAPCIKVNYVGFNTAFDEWFDLSKDSARIRPAATRAAAKLRVGLGELSPNQRMQEHKKAEICLVR